MSRRELLVIAGVLVPFFLLLALGLVSGRADAPAPTTVREDAAPHQPTRPVPPTPPTVPAPAPHASPSLVPDAGPPDAVPRELAAPLAAVTPEVLRCFADHRAHLHELQRLEVRFTPLPDGGFGEVRVPTHANPWVSACIEDVFDEVGFVPDGAETFEPARHTFLFDPRR